MEGADIWVLKKGLRGHPISTQMICPMGHELCPIEHQLSIGQNKDRPRKGTAMTLRPSSDFSIENGGKFALRQSVRREDNEWGPLTASTKGATSGGQVNPTPTHWQRRRTHAHIHGCTTSRLVGCCFSELITATAGHSIASHGWVPRALSEARQWAV
jgi:hypothetical protein